MKTQMWKRAGLALLVGLWMGVSPLNAAEGPASSVESSASGFWRSSAPVSFNIGGGASYFNGSTGWALSTGVAKQLSEGSPLFLALDLGFNFWGFGSAAGGPTQGATGVSLLPSLVYGFAFSGVKTVRPFVGVALGPQLYMERGQPARVFLQLMVRPGINLALGEVLSLNIEPRFGILGGNFAFLPTASAVMAL